LLLFTSKKYEIKIHNVISTADLKQNVDAPRLKNYSWGTYDLEYYGGRCGYVKDDSMSGVLLVNFKFVKAVQLMPKIQNIVATLNVQNKIDLKYVSMVIPEIIYEPEQFPAAIFRTSEGPVCLIFSTGKVVIVGSKSERQLTNCVRNLVKILKEFRILELEKN
jgi:TATA-box binding protein (TBP) (component of TFIID and TFIIIB)